MPRMLERATVDLVRKIYGGQEQPTPDWLQHPAAAEAGRRWGLVQATGMKYRVGLLSGRVRRVV
jgi:hypothetical protein